MSRRKPDQKLFHVTAGWYVTEDELEILRQMLRDVHENSEVMLWGDGIEVKECQRVNPEIRQFFKLED